ncbi:hypothetical protein DFQ14_11478 [Halopolyspora algeriensis]|uniref:Prevent-host-death family protein n=1 Tax=Halopolyspora algeriensis TaxID=1500506 RepID=A0A368VJJ4_9ACTN|nr:hypothetical protein [Halopolyspora algeriensis]RCW39814.1 hypothetical protein DFQ14_11478 [Halopolyspora algeriensis]TQM56469.1 hypothetical protein FHU43_1268 [Halopolyspora algeriensis]
MSEVIDVAEPAALLEELLDRAETGAEFLISRDGGPRVRLAPYHAFRDAD